VSKVSNNRIDDRTQHPVTLFVILLKSPPFILRGLRTNGGAIESVVVFPFMLSLVEAFLGFFGGIDYYA